VRLKYLPNTNFSSPGPPARSPPFFPLGPDDIPTYGVHVKNLLGTSGSYNIPIVCNRSNADFIISNNLFHGAYILILKD
jgi:methylglyoxal synthase